LGGIQCAVTRRDLQSTQPSYLPDEAFSVQEALDSYTSAGAYASFEETQKGQIQPGMLADFVVLGANPFCVDIDTIKDIPVRATFIGGRQVFGETL
jgi:predicted amidohydrolase YtcJ